MFDNQLRDIDNTSKDFDYSIRDIDNLRREFDYRIRYFDNARRYFHYRIREINNTSKDFDYRIADYNNLSRDIDNTSEDMVLLIPLKLLPKTDALARIEAEILVGRCSAHKIEADSRNSFLKTKNCNF